VRLGRVRLATEFDSGDGSRAQPPERFPDDLSPLRRGCDDSAHEHHRLLIQVYRGLRAWIVNARRRPLLVAAIPLDTV
jgi:hypothetical protein